MIDHELTDPTGSALTITHNDDGVWVTTTEDRDEVTVGPFSARALRASFDMGDDLADGGVTAAAIEAEVVSPERARSLVQENKDLRARIGQVEEARDLYRRDALTEERLHGEARRFALAWKETARRAVRQVHDEDGLTMRAARAAQRLATESGILRDEVVKAEQERDEADRRTAEAEAQRDQWKRHHDRVDGQWAKAEREVTTLRADRSRALTADDITDEMVERAIDAWVADEQRGDGYLGDAIRAILTAALTPPPSRPEGAEDLEALLREAWDRTVPFVSPTESAWGLADWLAERGVRAGGDS